MPSTGLILCADGGPTACDMSHDRPGQALVYSWVAVRHSLGSSAIAFFITLQELLHTPSAKSPAQSDAFVMLTQRPQEYAKRVVQEVKKYPPPM